MEKTQISKPEILKVEKLLEKSLHLPDYQRPYKWQIRHVQQLLNDLFQHFQQQKTYRIGTVVLHKNKANADIVDGQQRLTTLTLLLHCLGKQNLRLMEQEYQHSISQDNILKNYEYIKNFLIENGLSENNVPFKQYILDICEMVCVELDNLDEAFQFFDSQNARGKPLEAYDLLKAYHLRAMKDKSETVIHQCVAQWEAAALENGQAPNLNKIINQILFRLRAWQIGESGEQFTSNDLSVFKGVSEHSVYPYIQATLAAQALAKFSTISPLLFQTQFTRPNFQAKQTVIDGEWFFAYIQYYRQLYRQLFDRESGLLCRIKQVSGYELNKNLIEFLDTHQHHHRKGDRFLRGLFECLILAYFDKFGDERLDAFVNKAFAWVYRIRIESQRISFATIDKEVMASNSLFVHLERSHKPDDVMMFGNPPIRDIRFDSVDTAIQAILGIAKEKQ